MQHSANASFDVTNWNATPYDEPTDGPHLSRVAVSKAFKGDLKGTSTGEGLFCGMNAPASGAGYVVSERFSGRLGDRSGSFVLQHVGVAEPGAPAQSYGNIVPGSGTGELAGLSGEVEFGEDHTITLRYGFPETPAG
jgi:hypothetical protein